MKFNRKTGMTIFLLFLFSGSIIISAANILLKPKPEPVKIAVIETSKGIIEVELDTENAPITVANFVNYIESDYYDGLCFHRVMKKFMVQAGGFESDGTSRQTNDPIVSEATNGLSNLNLTIAMARSTDPNSASSQFFINTADNTFLDYVDAENPGYTVFGKVVKGVDVVKAIERVETANHEVYFPDYDYTTELENWPVQPITINDVYIK